MSVRKPKGWAISSLGFLWLKLLDVIQELPLSLPAALAAFSIVALGHLLIGQFKMSLVLPFGLAAAAAAWYYAHKIYEDDVDRKTRERRWFDCLVLGGLVLWMVFNMLFASQHIFTDRDPATYNNAGVWLINHSTLEINKPPISVLVTNPALQIESPGFNTGPNDSNYLQAQGAHLLPALQAIAGKAFGIGGVLRVNAFFGMVALLAFYGFARLVMKARWAALGTFIMALSLPMIFLTRDSYTEPLTMAFIFGGLSLLVHARRGMRYWQWWLAGMVFGAAALARIDAYLAFAGIILFAIVVLVQSRAGQRRQTAGCLIWFLAGLLGGGYLAWLDVSLLSTAYYNSHSQDILPELYLLALLVLVGTVVALLNWRFKLVQRLDALTISWRDRPIWALIGGFFVVLCSRPLWFVGYQAGPDGVTSTRSFSEQTMNWILWYYGPVTVVLAVAGLAVLVTSLLRRKDALFWPFTLAFLAMALLYLLQPNITGDQVWATRRLLPVVLPGFVLLALWSLERLYGQKRARWHGRSYDIRMTVAVLATISVISPLFVTYPFSLRKLYVPELSQIQAICAAVPKGSVVVWLGAARDFSIQPTRGFCGNDSVGLSGSDIPTTLAALTRQTKQPIVIGLYDSDKNLLPGVDYQRLTTISGISYNEIEHTYKRAPRNLITIHRTILMGRVGAGGTIMKL